jgi:hypothetical protein
MLQREIKMAEKGITRREFVTGLIPAAAAIGSWEIAKFGWRRRTRAGLEPVIGVFIFNKEKTEKLPRSTKKLIAECRYSTRRGYIAVGFNSEDDNARADIRHEYSGLFGDGIQEGCGRGFIKRDLAYAHFNFVANGPKIGTNREFKAERYLLYNEDLLEKIIEAKNLEAEEGRLEREKVFPKFDIQFRNYFKHEVANWCRIQLQDGVEYYVDGAEVLTDGDKNMFAEFWLARHRHKNFKEFKEAYDMFTKIRIDVEKARSGEEKAGKLFDSFIKNKHKYASSKEFNDSYNGFAEAAYRIEAAKLKQLINTPKS